ncbi:hypothetical protein EJ02DRAFT_390665 [Clathrospora elynae]|uniref:Uncharacterized protein n=1 Tax=Clathrospora elynae TaxID=706981 RepID=A0A6A5TA52_9PLEO|nr:hypothetical protein EJ02DRAFT_390665 [Clathrospora elynae]
MNQRAARVKALNQRVYISGLQGHHTLEVGVAYHYRGHYLYAYPARTPIEPIPFSTKKGINLSGIVDDGAPVYNPKARHLVPESEIAALQRSCFHEQERQKEQEEVGKWATKNALEEEARIGADGVQELPLDDPPSRAASFTTLLVPSQVVSRIGSHASLASLARSTHRLTASLGKDPHICTSHALGLPSATAYASQTVASTSYTPHDRGHYLAHSAPGSRHGSIVNTPQTSRPSSPPNAGGLSLRGHGSLLRPASSTSRLNQLLAEEGVRRAFSPLSEVAGGRDSHSPTGVLDAAMVANLQVEQEWIDPEDIEAFVQTVSRRPSRPSPHLLPRANSASPQAPTSEEDMDGGIYLPGLGHPELIRGTASRPYSPTRQISYEPHTPIPTSMHEPFHEYGERAAHLHGWDDQDAYSTGSSSRAQIPIPHATQEPGYPRSHGYGQVHGQAHHHGHAQSHGYAYGQVHAHDHFQGQAGTSSQYNYGNIDTATSSHVSTGRPRAASHALNEAYNAAHPLANPRVFATVTPIVYGDVATNAYAPGCTIHPEPCDGKTVTRKHMTQRAIEGAGFAHVYPLIRCQDGRVMVDWHKLLSEAMAEMDLVYQDMD